MVRIVEDIFGKAINPFTKQEENIRRFTLTNETSMTVQVVTLGATVTSIRTPDAKGRVDDVVLGYDDVAGYQTATNPYFGATVGRVCNRIGGGRFELAGRQIEVSRNWMGKHQLHGGVVGFDKAHWEVLSVDGRGGSVTMQHVSPDGHEGFPGELTATVTYTLSEDNCLHVRLAAATKALTVVNLTNHSYFNLAGHDSGKDGLYAHSIMIAADKLTETDSDSIPTGRFTQLDSAPAYDLRTLGNLGQRLNKLLPLAGGFDDNYCVNLQNNATTVVAKATHPGSGRWLEIASNQPGVQFYTSNGMPDIDKGEPPIRGKAGAAYGKHAAFCLETQKYPDAVNHANFPSITLQPGEQYNHEVIYKFGVCRNAAGCGQ